MYGQVYQSFSNSDHNVTFANHVGRHGLSLWPWIISHRHSQADVGGPLACTFIALEFIRLVLVNPCLQAGILRRGDDLGPVLAALLQENIFQTSLAVCARLAGDAQMESPERAFQYLRLGEEVTPLLYSTERVFTPGCVGDFISALEETGLPSALTLTYSHHTRACIYIPHRRVPLFLVFDSVCTFGYGASIVVHSTRASATAHLSYLCPPMAGEDGHIEADFFVSRETAQSDLHKARIASMKLHLRFGDGLRFRDVGRAQGRPVNDLGPGEGPMVGQTARGGAAEQVGAQDDPPSTPAPQFPPRPQTSTRTARPPDDLAPGATAAELAELKEKQILADGKWAWDEQLREIKNAHRHQNYTFSGPTPMARPQNPLPPAPRPSTWSATRAVTPSDNPAPGGTAAKIAELQMQVARLQAQIEADRVEVARLQNDARRQGRQNYPPTPPSTPPMPISHPQTYPFREPLDNNPAPTWTLPTSQREQDDPFLCATAPAQNAWMTPPRRATMITPDLTPEEIRAQRVLAAEQRRRVRSYRQRENLASLNHMDAHGMSDRYAGMQLERPVN